MVTILSATPSDGTNVQSTPLVVELVGPAGAGKTTLTRVLSQGQGSIVEGRPPFVWSVAALPFFAKHGLLMLPMLLHLDRDGERWLTRREIAWMAILNGWHHVLRHRAVGDGAVIVLDQGPVFTMAELQVCGPKSLRSESAESWWQVMYSQWAAALDIVVYLDAPDTELLRRIRTRGKWHLVKNKPDAEVFAFLDHYRAVFEQLIATFTAYTGGPEVLRFDTARESPDAITERLLARFGLNDLGHESWVHAPTSQPIVNPDQKQCAQMNQP